MKTITRSFTVFLYLFILQSCLFRYGIHTQTDYTPLSSEKYENTNGTVDIYLEGVPVERPFKQIGMVEVVGERQADNQKLLAYLKDTALKNGADAVIEVKKLFKRREEGIVAETEHADVYSASVLTGIAIKYTDEPPLDSLAIASVDTSFKHIVQKDKEKVKANYMLDFIFSIIAGVIILWGVSSQSN